MIKKTIIFISLVGSLGVGATEYLIKQAAPGMIKVNKEINTFGLNSCKEIIDKYPAAKSGEYKIKLIDSEVNVSCDMDTDNGGWSLVLSYLHKGGTNPPLVVMNDKLPLLSSGELGDNGYEDSKSWGHISNKLFSSMNVSEVRFQCNSSETLRVADFKTESRSLINYFGTGVGSVSLPMKVTVFSDNNAYMINPNATYKNQGEEAMTTFPFYRTGSYHWSVKGGGKRWECDTYAGNYRYHTNHKIWIR